MCILHVIKSLLVSPSYLFQVKFEILLVSPQARGLKEGRTEVKEFLFVLLLLLFMVVFFFFFSLFFFSSLALFFREGLSVE